MLSKVVDVGFLTVQTNVLATTLSTLIEERNSYLLSFFECMTQDIVTTPGDVCHL